jgi:RNA polymerase sigma factor (TIGR02999 family)
MEGVTVWLRRLREGDAGALDELLPLLYDELRAVARHQLRSERAGHTLSATALVHEAYLRMSKDERIRADDRTQFLALAGNAMRRVLVDWARHRKRHKRGGGAPHVPLDEASALSDREADEVLALDDALERLTAVNPRGAKVVEHRFFAGLSLEETATLLGVSTKTVRRDWLAARAWLRKEVRGGLGS